MLFRSKIDSLLAEAGVNVPLMTELVTGTGLPVENASALLAQALKIGLLQKVGEKRLANYEGLAPAAEAFSYLADRNELVEVVAYKRHLGIGRNLAIELLEFFDRIQLTRRVGNGRILVNPSALEQRFGRNQGR